MDIARRESGQADRKQIANRVGRAMSMPESYPTRRQPSSLRAEIPPGVGCPPRMGVGAHPNYKDRQPALGGQTKKMPTPATARVGA